MPDVLSGSYPVPVSKLQKRTHNSSFRPRAQTPFLFRLRKNAARNNLVIYVRFVVNVVAGPLTGEFEAVKTRTRSKIPLGGSATPPIHFSHNLLRQTVSEAIQSAKEPIPSIVTWLQKQCPSLRFGGKRVV